MSIEYKFRFEPVNGATYYAYQRPDGSAFASVLSPEEWGKRYIDKKFTYLHKLTFKDGEPTTTND
tara:strand:- start:1176 stop:1370 length:195 start_codon:yes stop_codon:yes gene_type:complete